MLKMRARPVARLVEERKIGPEELQAAMDLTTAFHALTGMLWIKPQSFQKIDRAKESPFWPLRVAECVSDYTRFAQHWSARAKLGDRTLEIVIAAVIDERAFSAIDADVGVRHGKAIQATIAGLRDYAARAGIMTGKVADDWIEQAAMVFVVKHPDLRLAVARGKAPFTGQS